MSDWKRMFGYKSTDTYKNVYGRAYTQMKMAQSFNKSSIPKIQKALAEAKVYFNSKSKIPKRSPISHTGGKVSNKNLGAFVRRARA
jgi:hypothetical protein